MARPLAVAGQNFLGSCLNVIFGAPGHVALLRSLFKKPAGMTGREVARMSGMAQQAALNGLGRLEAAGVVRRALVGNAHLFTLNTNLKIVREAIVPMLSVESSIKASLLEALKKGLSDEVVSGIVFGSVAREQDRPDSDLDVLLIVEKEADRERANAAVDVVSDEARAVYGVTLNPIIYTKERFVSGVAAGDAFLSAIVKDGREFTGLSLFGLLHDKKDAKIKTRA